MVPPVTSLCAVSALEKIVTQVTHNFECDRLWILADMNNYALFDIQLGSLCYVKQTYYKGSEPCRCLIEVPTRRDKILSDRVGCCATPSIQ
jgi:hypothetical protein